MQSSTQPLVDPLSNLSRPAFSISRSFTRLDSSSSPSPDHRPRSRATSLRTVQTPLNPTIFENPISSSPTSEQIPGDVFAVPDGDEQPEGMADESLNPSLKIPQSFDQLPIELRSLTESFLESLSAKSHSAPVNIDAVAEMYQDFYVRAEAHISTHIATLSSRLSRERSTSSLKSGQSSRSNSPQIGSKPSAAKDSPNPDQQMLSTDELLDRRKARRLLEVKRTALEELIERAACEKVYDKIWRHRSSDDEERDHKLRSKIAALSVVGIGLKELLAGADEIPDQVRARTVEEQDRIKSLLAPARQSLRDMSEVHHPQGKLHHLSATHKAVVETLSQLFPSTSSADEILPTLIYALMTSSPEHVNVLSDLRFIQRFRAASKVDGETAYCLVNLEAAISFLETVDLSSLRSEETPQGPEKTTSRPSTPLVKSTPMNLGIAPASAPETNPGRPQLAAPKNPRRLSNLLTTQTTRLEAASDSFRSSVLNGADEAFDTINNTIENSFRFFFGRLREQQASEAVGSPVMPKTLEDARKLVSNNPSINAMDDSASVASGIETGDGRASPETALPRTASGDRMLELIGGRRSIRDRSVDSTRSGGSGKRVSFVSGMPSGHAAKSIQGLGIVPTSTSTVDDASSTAPKDVPVPPTSTLSKETVPIPTASAATSPAITAASGAVEGIRNLGSTLNPLNQFAKIGFFGRTVSPASGMIPASSRARSVSGASEVSSAAESTPMQVDTTASTKPTSASGSRSEPARSNIISRPLARYAETSSSTAFDSLALAATQNIKAMLTAEPPVQKFVDCKDAGDLRVNEVQDLLRDYQRVVAILGKLTS